MIAHKLSITFKNQSSRILYESVNYTNLDLIPVGGKTHQHENQNFAKFTYCKVDHLSLKYYFYFYWYRLTPIWSLILIIIYFRSSCDSWRGRWGLSKDNGHRCKLVPIHTIYNILFHLIIIMYGIVLLNFIHQCDRYTSVQR